MSQHILTDSFFSPLEHKAEENSKTRLQTELNILKCSFEDTKKHFESEQK